MRTLNEVRDRIQALREQGNVNNVMPVTLAGDVEMWLQYKEYTEANIVKRIESLNFVLSHGDTEDLTEVENEYLRQKYQKLIEIYTWMLESDTQKDAPPITRELIMSAFREDNLTSIGLSPDDRLEIFSQIMLGSSDLSVELFNELLKDYDAGYTVEAISEDDINISWSVDDILHQANEDNIGLTRKQARKVLALLDKHHDATIGINWDVISDTIAIYLDHELKTL